jgi:hypothetical protein
MRKSLAFILLAACSNDPVYIPAPMAIEAGMDDGMGGTAVGIASLTLPVKLETATDATERAQRTTALGVDVPYVKVGDIEVSVEWKVTNLDAMPGDFEIQLNGANEYYEYDPALLAVGLDDEEPVPPGLDGDVPIHVEPMASVTGLFREDQVKEAAIDLDEITRGNFNPFRATLTISKNVKQFAQLTPQMYDMDGEPLPQMNTGIVYPREAFPMLIRINMVFKPNRHMRFEYTVRVRDSRGILHELLDAAVTEAPGELTMFMPMTYAPAAP